MKTFAYTDSKVIHREKLYYLRSKFGRRGSTCVLTIRTQASGKGVNVASVKGVIKDDLSQLQLLHRLNKKFSFQYIQILNIPEMPK